MLFHKAASPISLPALVGPEFWQTTRALWPHLHKRTGTLRWRQRKTRKSNITTAGLRYSHGVQLSASLFSPGTDPAL